MKPTLLILAAGMGSRYGGLKQLDKLGPNGEAIIDYSINDAIHAGFGKIVFVIRRHFAEDFKNIFEPKFDDKIKIEYVLQEYDAIPEGVKINPAREKPLGTGHAVWVAHKVINEPFGVINADDFYGRQAYVELAHFLNSISTYDHKYCMIGYDIKNTLSDHGTVNRGICEADTNGNLTTIVERKDISENKGKISCVENGEEIIIKNDAVVSMNMFGFSASYFKYAEDFIIKFTNENYNNLKAEFYIPSLLDELIAKKEITLKVLNTSAKWFGVTYQEDKPIVMAKLKEFKEKGIY